ncbi:hypothetical protein GWI72_09875 [Microvirga tunisiensis]|uniref:NO-binding membrane sensor protein with MHYT domain n=1 Tax=Pannonibacter tanglangensis TaxID=2750084 RepID=A0A7X5F2I8_9HYPH|nr:MHYT domain-containing protein [Pannonibacter sp. XCT-53]NBN78575.1 hypothetical protein [Pannonibacter sp. XCT-53]
MGLTHEPWLVALSVLVAFQGSFAGLSMAVRVGEARLSRRRVLLAGSALTLALGIWSMHFVGMLAARLPVAVDFLVLPTLLSFLVCVLVVGVAVFAASRGRAGLTRLRLVVAAFVMGTGIASMHYLGMLALHASSHMTHNPRFVGASFLVAFCASGLAVWLAFGHGRRPPVLVSALVLALAISAMHYIAMAGMTLMPLAHAHADAVPLADAGAPAVSPGILAIIVSVVAFLVSGLFLLTLVPDADELTRHAHNGLAESGLAERERAKKANAADPLDPLAAEARLPAAGEGRAAVTAGRAGRSSPDAADPAPPPLIATAAPAAGTLPGLWPVSAMTAGSGPGAEAHPTGVEALATDGQTGAADLAALAGAAAARQDVLAEPLRRVALGLQGAPDEARLRGLAGRTHAGAGGASLPIEREGTKARLPVADLVAVQADAHYTRLYDLQRAYFCPLSITEVERLLDARQFTRVHRSHIVSLAHVRALRRAGDSGIVLLDGQHGHSVPVSRSKWPHLKTRLAAGTASAAE